jgi:hypothetical protein
MGLRKINSQAGIKFVSNDRTRTFRETITQHRARSSHIDSDVTGGTLAFGVRPLWPARLNAIAPPPGALGDSFRCADFDRDVSAGMFRAYALGFYDGVKDGERIGHPRPAGRTQRS